MAKLYLGLGSNLGDRAHYLDKAIAEIQSCIGPVIERSEYYASEPWGYQSSNTFLNACICVETTLHWRKCLELAQEIEQRLGRTISSRTSGKTKLAGQTQDQGQTEGKEQTEVKRPAEYKAKAKAKAKDKDKDKDKDKRAAYQDREIDIDLLLYDQLVLNEPDLVLPHPLMHKRKFVLLPLSRIAPDLQHPVLERSVQELLSDLD